MSAFVGLIMVLLSIFAMGMGTLALILYKPRQDDGLLTRWELNRKIAEMKRIQKRIYAERRRAYAWH